MGWRAARSLLTLRAQVDARYPGRSRASDGTIGDLAHQAQVSDHNPDDDVDGDGIGEGPGVDDIVRALDLTHDPDHGLDIDQLSDALVASRDNRISYVIANRMITGPEYGWVWTAYGGDDPHTGHLHLSVVGDARADDPRPWSIGDATAAAGTMEDEMMLLKDKTGPTIVLTDWRVTLTPPMADVTALRAGGVTYAEVSAGTVATALALPRPGAAPAAAVTLSDAQAAAIGDRIGAALAGRAGLTRAEVAGAVRDALRIAP